MSYSNIKIGDEAPDIVNVVVEIPKGSHNKYEYDEELDEIKLDRVLHSFLFFPADYGFIPQTRSEDGDHLDAFVLISDPVFPGCLVSARPIGALDMTDDAGHDSKIVAVASKDPVLSNIKSLDDLDEHYKKEIIQFFEQYKKLENKWVKVTGWKDKKEALAIIDKASKVFQAEKHDMV